MTKPEEDPTLQSVAEAVADGLPVDWDGVGASQPGLAQQLDRLRFLEVVATAHREASGQFAAPAGVTATESQDLAVTPGSRSGGHPQEPRSAHAALRVGLVLTFAVAVLVLLVWIGRGRTPGP